ncbi:hypothetical protein [Methyloversatilis sp.]|uniref:hypothetical protein n=1 Tax=Methyloversatilis sp. TaxID=2569862 RepID=UPI0035B27526
MTVCRAMIPQRIARNPRQYWDAKRVTASLQANVTRFARKSNTGARLPFPGPTFTNRYATRNEGLQQAAKLILLPEHSGPRRYET